MHTSLQALELSKVGSALLSARPRPLEEGEAAGSGWSLRRITTAAV
jgi:hypothetical protein